MGGADKNGVQLQELPDQNNQKATKRKHKDTADEQSNLIACQKLPPETAVCLYRAALGISWFSILFSLGTGIAGIVLSVAGKSEALFAYGLDAILDSFSSVACVWRFHGDVNCVYSIARERKACIAIGFLFLVSAASLIGKSLHAILSETHETKQVVLYESFALTCAVISIVVAITKIYVGIKVRSQALYTDSIITLVGAAACIAGVAGLELYVENTDLWYLDSLFGILCGLFLLLFGAKLLYTKLREKPESMT